jgi:predicted heme/steroid binding protein
MRRFPWRADFRGRPIPAPASVPGAPLLATIEQKGFVMRTGLSLTPVWIPLLFLVFVLFGLASIVYAYPEFAEETGKDCTFCHTEAGGGPVLTEAGKAYRDEGAGGLAKLEKSLPAAESRSLPRRIAWLLVGFFHIAAGFAWLGTIMYVHIVLKPAYAATGLPPGEVRLAWVCIVIIGITGVLLTVRAIPTPGLLLSTSFGQIVLGKIVVYSLMVLVAALATFVLGPRLKPKATEIELDGKTLSTGLTEGQLAQFDGADGKKALIAYQGAVYDVTGSRLWKKGLHMKRHRAGTLQEDALPNAPHGAEVLEKVPEISKIVPSQRRADVPRVAFYVMAYLVLLLVFAMLFLLALLRFWK